MENHTESRRLTAEQLQTWRDYIEVARALDNQMAERMQQTSAVSAADYPILLALQEAPENRLRSSALADTVGWQRSRVSHQLGRMEKRGLIRRETCAADSRGSEVVLTGQGAAAFKRAAGPHMRDIHELFVDALTPAQMRAAADIAATLRAHLGEGA